MSDTIRIQGFQADLDAVNVLTPVAYTTSSAEILSTAEDYRTHPRKRVLAIIAHKADATSTGVTVTVKESATSGGSYSTATFTGTAGASTGARVMALAIKPNPDKPFIKISLTPAGGSGVVSAALVFLGDSV